VRAAIVIAVVAASSVAHANRVALMAGDSEQRAALGVALAGRAEVVGIAPPQGPLRLDRAAAAQRAAIDVAADAAAWLDAGELCVVSADGAYFRHAPLPAGESPRVFAAIATSLLDELLAPPEAALPPIHVDVHVDAAAAAAPPLPRAEPTVAATSVVPNAPPPRLARTAIQIGPMVTPVSAGIEAGVAFRLSSRLRLGAIGFVDTWILDPPGVHGSMTAPFAGGAVELSAVGVGDPHLDLGVIAGAFDVVRDDQGDAIKFAALRLGVTWSMRSSAISLSVAPGIAVSFLGDASVFWASRGAFPIAWTSLRWELPL
jgi:hypothetical protein